MLGASLGLFCALSASILAFTNNITKTAIEKTIIEKNNKAIKEILSGFDNKPDQDKILIKENGHEIVFYPALKDGKLIGIAAQSTSPKGFGGDLTVMLSMSPQGIVENVIVVKNNETPGLGTVVTDRIRQKTIFDLFSPKKEETSGLPQNKVLDSFRNLNSDTAPWEIKKDGGGIESITGATISSRAVTDAVNMIAEAFNNHKDEIRSAGVSAQKK